jgi:hypothetical protein
VELAHKKALSYYALSFFYKDSMLVKISTSMFNNRFVVGQEYLLKEQFLPLFHPDLKEPFQGQDEVQRGLTNKRRNSG